MILFYPNANCDLLLALLLLIFLKVTQLMVVDRVKTNNDLTVNLIL